MTATIDSSTLDRQWLLDLEDEAIHIIREVAGQFERPVILFSGGKDSIVMLHLAVKAFWPGRVPFQVMHVDTGHNFPEVIEYRDRHLASLGVELVVASVQESIDCGRVRETPGQSRNPLQTTTLLDAINGHRFDAVLGGARRDEEKARAKERIFSVRDDFGQWDPRNQRPELWDLYNGRHRPGEHVRVFPISNWTELDIWSYIAHEGLDVPSIYYAHQRQVFNRDGMLLSVTPWTTPREDEPVTTEWVRYRTVGDATCTGAVRSIAANADEVILETAAATVSERGATRADDRASEAAMGRPEAARLFPVPGELLRVVTAGSVDDGKSTLVGRLLHDAKAVLTDQLTAVEVASARRGYGGADLALLVDGLRAEREQGITIDVAYRYFATAERTFILADTPGHVQYTRNTVTGASTADVAVILVDARTGVVEQTKRHAAVAALLRVEHVVLAVNKMDLVDYAEDVFDEIVADFASAANSLSLTSFVPIPVAALIGDNVVERSTQMTWYDGPSLLEYLEQVKPRAIADVPGRFPVQIVIRPRTSEHPDYRGYAGRVEGGTLTVGDDVIVLPAGRATTITAIDTLDGPLPHAAAGRSVTLRLRDDVDIARGDLIVADREPRPAVARELVATVCWLVAEPLRPGARLLLRHTTRQVRAIVESVQSRLDVASLTSNPADELGLNDIGTIGLRTSEPVMVDPYEVNRSTGAFLLVDETTGATVAAGMVARS